MIKINLAKEFMPKKKGLFGGGAPRMESLETLEASSEQANLNKALIVRLVILLIGPIALFIYQDSNIPPKIAMIGTLNGELSTLSQKNQQAAASVSEIKKFEKEEERLKAQIMVIENLQKDRLKEVRVMDYIQREIPEKVWLSKMGLADGKMSIEGLATGDSELTNFMDGLQGSAYLKDVSLVRSNEVNTPETGVVRKFEISCLLERSR